MDYQSGTLDPLVILPVTIDGAGEGEGSDVESADGGDDAESTDGDNDTESAAEAKPKRGRKQGNHTGHINGIKQFTDHIDDYAMHDGDNNEYVDEDCGASPGKSRQFLPSFPCGDEGKEEGQEGGRSSKRRRVQSRRALGI